MKSNRDLALVFKALSDDTRLDIVGMLRNENLCACHILDKFNITQPTLSYHMKILVESGLVDSSKDGNWTRYQLNKEYINDLNVYTRELINDQVTIDRKIEKC